ncbi:MAG: DNA polymerase I [Clostridia bacterium]|nr:DNA polymerase I [Clostridia bacterium]
MAKASKFIIIDGNSLIHRAFYALPLLTTSQGVFTNAVYGFTNMLLKIMEEEKPDYLVVAFDKGKPTFRVETYAEYKGHRKGTPDELRPQFPIVKQVLEAMCIPFFEEEGYEADDLIGTLVSRAEQEGINSRVVTGDRDALQLVSEATQVLITRKGISEIEKFDGAALEEKYGLTPQQIIDLKALMGDSSDNIPGVPGVGEKTALKLLHQFGSVEKLYEEIDQVTGKLKDKLLANKDLAWISKGLATIVRDVPMEISWDECRVCEPDDPRLLELFKNLEFKNLVKKVMDRMGAQGIGSGKGSGGVAPEPAHQGAFFAVEGAYKTVVTLNDWEDLRERLKTVTDVTLAALSADPKGHAGQVAALVLGLKSGENWYLDLSCEVFLNPEVMEELFAFLDDSGINKIVHDGKRLLWLFCNTGWPLQGLAFDTMVAAYLVNPAKPSQKFREVCLEYLNTVIPGEDTPENWSAGAALLWQLRDVLNERLLEMGMEKLYYEVELPLVEVLAGMEMAGVAVDGNRLREMSVELTKIIDDLTEVIYALAGENFNINSPKQLAVILFEKLNLPVLKKTKTGYSTDAEVLEQLAEEHQIVDKILEYRQYVKLKSTYVDGLSALINPATGKIHTTFNQTVTATGRLSSTEPNLQNIPIRLEEGRKIRKVFMPSPDNLMVTADYSQIELRILAHISGDANLINAFLEEQDIHTRTASEVFDVATTEVTSEMRSRAKAVNFGIVYGISDYGLARDIKVSRTEAKLYIESYFHRYPGVKAWIDEIIAQAKSQGYVTTLLNRRRYLSDILSKNFNIRSFGERTAMNTPIQGSAADIIKLAMVKIQDQLAARDLKTQMLLQVHDELIFDVPKDELEEVVALVKDSMEGAIKLKVPLVVDVKVGPNWYDAHKYA